MRHKAGPFVVFTTVSLLATPAMAQTEGIDGPSNESPPIETPIVDNGVGDAVVQLNTTTTSPVYPGLDAWVNLMWTGDATLDAREFKLTAVGSEGVEVGYPQNYSLESRDHSSLSVSDVLVAGGYDFTALRLVVDPEAVDPTIDLTVSYVSDNGPVTQTFTAKVGIDTTAFEGEALEIETGMLGQMMQESSGWFPIEVTALHNASNVSLTVSDANGFGNDYPNEVEYASLSKGSRIVKGETDFGAIRFDSHGLDAGTYPVQIDVEYYVGTTKVTQTVERLITIQAPPGPEPVDPVLVEPVPVEPVPVEPEPSEPEPSEVTVFSIANGIEGWSSNPYGTDSATTGEWGYGQPVEGTWHDLLLEMGSTPSGNPGLFTMSGTGDAIGEHDVDGGNTSLRSPAISLPVADTVTLDFSYYLSYLSNANSKDALSVVMITDDGNKMLLLEQATANRNQEAKWLSKTVNLSAYAGQDVQFLVTVGDNDSKSFVEAGIDGFVIVAK